MFEGDTFCDKLSWLALFVGMFLFYIIFYHNFVSQVHLSPVLIHSFHLYGVTSQQQAEGMLVELQVNMKVYNISVSQNTNLGNHLDN